MPSVLATALALDLSPPRPWEWAQTDVAWWQELVDARNAYEQGRRSVDAEERASDANREWQASMAREWGLA